MGFLYNEQLQAVSRMKNGCILNGDVGTGKSRTALYYYFVVVCGGEIQNKYKDMKNPMDLLIITTAGKRDSKEWEAEMLPFLLSTDPHQNHYSSLANVTVDSWNNIKKYQDITNTFIIFDEDRVIGYGAWSKAFIKMAKANKWVMLSATPGDDWKDYISVFIANGFYKNKTEFEREHIIYKRSFAGYPQIDRYINTSRLMRLRRSILVPIEMERITVAHHINVNVSYDEQTYKYVWKERKDPETFEPIDNIAGVCYILRKITNNHWSRAEAVVDIMQEHEKAIIFYNFDFELDILKNLDYPEGTEVAEMNGHKHQPLPKGDRWVYLVHYNSGAEGWNCISTDTIIFYSQNYSYRIMKQASGRIDRRNTPYVDLYYYHLKTKSSIDMGIANALRKKKKFNETKFIGQL